MAPSGPRRSSRIKARKTTPPTTSTKTKQRRKISYKKCQVEKKVQETSLEDLPSNSSTTTCEDVPKSKNDDCIDFEAVDSCPSSACSTPKAERFRTPEIKTCPPAPKKQRVLSNCSIKRSPLAFFAPPDLELFFVFASRDISV